MTRWVDATAPVGGLDALAVAADYADPLRAERERDPLGGGIGGDTNALAGSRGGAEALAGSRGGGADALAGSVGGGTEPLAAAAVPGAPGTDPLTGYPDATLLLGSTGLAAPVPAVAPPPMAGPVPPRRADDPSPRPGPARSARRRSGSPGSTQQGQPAARGDGSRTAAGRRTASPSRPSPGRSPGARGQIPGQPAGGWAPGQQAARRTGGGAAGAIPPIAGPRRDAISWSELTMRGRAAADRRPAPPPLSRRSPARGGPTGWDDFFGGSGRRAPWTGRPTPAPQSLRELIDLIRRSLRG